MELSEDVEIMSVMVKCWHMLGLYSLYLLYMQTEFSVKTLLFQRTNTVTPRRTVQYFMVTYRMTQHQHNVLSTDFLYTDELSNELLFLK